MNKISWWIQFIVASYLAISMLWAMIGRFFTFYTPPIVISIGSLIGTIFALFLLFRMLFVKG